MTMPRRLMRLDSGGDRTFRVVVAGLVLLGLSRSTAAAEPDHRNAGVATVPDDRDVSAGRWNVIAAEWDGTPVDQEWLARLQVVYQADGSWCVFLRRIPVAAGKSTSRQDLFPKTFEMETLGSEGIDPSRYTGIYRLEGDTRLLCLVPEGEPRPDDFKAPRNSRRLLVTLERAHGAAGGK